MINYGVKFEFKSYVLHREFKLFNRMFLTNSANVEFITSRSNEKKPVKQSVTEILTANGTTKLTRKTKIEAFKFFRCITSIIVNYAVRKSDGVIDGVRTVEKHFLGDLKSFFGSST